MKKFFNDHKKESKIPGSNEKNTHIEKTVLLTFIALFFLYINLFGDTGLFSRNKLDKQKEKLIKLQISLNKDKKMLQERFALLQDDSSALELEAKKYLLLSEKTRILRFKEDKSSLNANNSEKKNDLIVGSVSQEKKKSIHFYRTIYILASLFLIGFLIYIDWKQNNQKVTFKEKHIQF